MLKVGDKVRVGASTFHGFDDGSICIVGKLNYNSEYVECTDKYGYTQWVESGDISKVASDSDIELAYQMNKIWELKSKNSELFAEMVDMVEQLGLLKGDVIDDRLVTNFADRYLGGF